MKPSGETRNGNTKNTKAARRARSCDLRADFVTFVFESLGQTDRRHPRRQARGAPIFFNGGAPAGAGETWYYKGKATNGFRSRRRAASSGQPKLALGASVLAEISTGEKAHALLLSLRFALLQVVARYSDRALFDPLNSADLLGAWGQRSALSPRSLPLPVIRRYPGLIGAKVQEIRTLRFRPNVGDCFREIARDAKRPSGGGLWFHDGRSAKAKRPRILRVEGLLSTFCCPSWSVQVRTEHAI